MEFNAGIFSFTGTRKSPLNMLRTRALTVHPTAADAASAPAAMSSPDFSLYYQ
jgi:hypothetical protein